jgi:hypothetical protein
MAYKSSKYTNKKKYISETNALYLLEIEYSKL